MIWEVRMKKRNAPFLGLSVLTGLLLACALEWQAGIFVTSDHRQSAAAVASGLRVVAV